MKAFYGRPSPRPVPGGTQLTVYLVPVFEGRLVCFDVVAEEARGRWLPWDVLDHQENPYEAASELADFWCGVPPLNLELVDIMSLSTPGGTWELAVIFRGEFADRPTGDADRVPHLFDYGRFDAVAAFDPVDLERWVLKASSPVPLPFGQPDPAGEKLVF